MTRDEIITLLLRRAGQREGDAELRSQLEEEIKFVQDSFERSGIPVPAENGSIVFWPDFLLSEVSSFTTISGDRRIAIPNDFLSEADDGGLFYHDGSAWLRLEKRDFGFLQDEYSGTGPPTAYALFGNCFYVFPEPDSDYTLRLVYFQRDAMLDDNFENFWLKWAPDLILNSLGEIMESHYLQDLEAAQVFSQKEVSAAKKLYAAEGVKTTASRSIPTGISTLGVPDDTR